MVEGIKMRELSNQRLAKGMVLAVRSALASKQVQPAELMLSAIRLLWPDCPELLELNATVLYMTFRSGEALALLHGHGDTRALIIRAACLMRLNDPDWREPLMEVLKRNDDEIAVKCAHRLFEVSGESLPALTSDSMSKSIQELIFFQGVKA